MAQIAQSEKTSSKSPEVRELKGENPAPKVATASRLKNVKNLTLGLTAAGLAAWAVLHHGEDFLDIFAVTPLKSLCPPQGNAINIGLDWVR